MHLVVCTVGTVLAMAGHFPHRARLWVPHVVGLTVMLSVSYGVGGGLARWVGIALLLLLTTGSIRRLDSLRERVEAGVDAAAMSVLVAAVPAMPAGGSMTGMGGHPDGPGLALVVVTLATWATARVAASHRLPHQGAVAGTRLARVNLTGSVAMLAGMTLMII